MATEPTSRIATLPGFDTAPDVYETNNSSSPEPSHTSETSDTSEEEDEEESYGVSRQRLYPERARHRFGQDARSIKTRGADLSDRVDGRRRGFRRGGVEEESLSERLARLKREVEECRVLAEKESGEAEGSEGDEVEALGRLLAGLDVPKTRSKEIAADGDEFHDATENGEDDEDEGQTGTTKDLSKVSDFDARLAALETALGLSETDPTAPPLLPTLTLLDQQLATLNSSTSLTALESASSRIVALKNSAAELSELQQQTQSSDSDEQSSLLSPADMERLQSLYTILPTLQSLAPTVPALITRLRSLRTLHTTAASASADLDSVEQRQAEMDKELKMWREGLERVEKAVKDADEANGRNGSFVKGWVDDLEKRMEGLR